MHLACQALGGQVQGTPTREYGRAHCRITGAERTVRRHSRQIEVWMSHGDQVSQASDDFLPLAATDTCPLAAVKHRQLPIYGLQFHPEVTHTPQGAKILGNFLKAVCHCSGTWKLGDFARETIEAVRRRVGDDRVICGLSGGVDSSVVAALLAQAIGPQLSCILVDNGLLRKDEEESVIQRVLRSFQDRPARGQGGGEVPGGAGRRGRSAGKTPAHRPRLHRVLCRRGGQDRRGPVPRPGHALSRRDRERRHARRTGRHDQAAPQRGRTARGPGVRADRAAARSVQGRGPQAGRATRPAGRHRLASSVPRAGPGRALRGRGDEERLDILREADAIVVAEIKQAGLYRKTAQAFAVLLPVQSVGVMGDARTYADVVAVRSIDTEDFMTADWSHLPYELLARISTRIINEVKGVNRVVYDISSKPPATIEWE